MKMISTLRNWLFPFKERLIYVIGKLDDEIYALKEKVKILEDSIKEK